MFLYNHCKSTQIVLLDDFHIPRLYLIWTNTEKNEDDDDEEAELTHRVIKYLQIFTVTTNSLVKIVIYMTASFDPKLGSSSGQDTRTCNIYRN
jgi:hypothetical protein